MVSPASPALTGEDIYIMIDTVWMMLGGSMIFFMSAGFAMLEVGSYNNNVTMSVLVKNIVVKLSTAIVWWVWGFGMAIGEDANGGFVGRNHYGPKSETLSTRSTPYEVYLIREMFFQWGPCFIAATIAGGAMGERIRMDSYILYTVFMSGLIYPCVVHWGFYHSGWLVSLDTPFVDVGGSGMVHMVGGMSALVGCIIAGKRDVPDPQPHSVPLIILGTLILWFGWYGYNAGSFRITGIESIPVIARICVNCTLAAASAGISCVYMRRYMNPEVRIDIIPLCNGVLGGLVAISGSCAFVDFWAAVVIGLVAGIVYPFLAWLEHEMDIEDPVEAAPLHYGCGLWGVIATGLLHEETGFFTTGKGSQLGTQTIAAIVITGWVAFWCALIFGSFKFFNILNFPAHPDDGEEQVRLTPYQKLLIIRQTFLEYCCCRDPPADKDDDSVESDDSSARRRRRRDEKKQKKIVDVQPFGMEMVEDETGDRSPRNTDPGHRLRDSTSSRNGSPRPNGGENGDFSVKASVSFDRQQLQGGSAGGYPTVTLSAGGPSRGGPEYRPARDEEDMGAGYYPDYNRR